MDGKFYLCQPIYLTVHFISILCFQKHDSPILNGLSFSVMLKYKSKDAQHFQNAFMKLVNLLKQIQHAHSSLETTHAAK